VSHGPPPGAIEELDGARLAPEVAVRVLAPGGRHEHADQAL
jgi:hypothetical protein